MKTFKTYDWGIFGRSLRPLFARCLLAKVILSWYRILRVTALILLPSAVPPRPVLV